MDENKIRKYRDLFSENFLFFFKNNNFQYHPPLPLRITFDKTLSFSNSTICIFKYYELHNKKCKDYITVQKGLRTNTYKTLLNNNKDLLWNAHLTMLGGYVNSSSENTIQILEENIYLFLKFLRSIFDNSQKILITIPNKIKLNLKNEIIQSENLEIIFLDEEDENLNWKFGLPNFSGVGIRWELKNDNRLFNCGNHIIMYKNNSPVGIDFGFGLENLVQVKLNLYHKILASPFSSVFNDIKEEYNNLDVKMVDALATYITIIEETNFNNENFTKSLKRTQEYYLNAIIFIMKQMTEEKFNIILDSIISTNQNWIAKDGEIKLFLLEKIKKKLDVMLKLKN